MRQTGWRSLFEWTLAYALLTVAALGMMSIGIFVLPIAIAALIVAARRNSGRAANLFGGLLGVGTTCLVIAFGNREYTPCSGGTIRLAPGESYHCGGRDPAPWLTVGVILALPALAGFTLYRRTHGDAAP